MAGQTCLVGGNGVRPSQLPGVTEEHRRAAEREPKDAFVGTSPSATDVSPTTMPMGTAAQRPETGTSGTPAAITEFSDQGAGVTGTPVEADNPRKLGATTPTVVLRAEDVPRESVLIANVGSLPQAATPLTGTGVESDGMRRLVRSEGTLMVAKLAA